MRRRVLLVVVVMMLMLVAGLVGKHAVGVLVRMAEVVRCVVRWTAIIAGQPFGARLEACRTLTITCRQ